MSFRVWLVMASAAVALAFGCNRVTSPSPAPATASAASLSVSGPAGTLAAAVKKEADERLINMEDACDPETFNAAIGPGTCVRSGGVRFDTFLDQLRKHGTIGAWHFAPSQLTMHAGGHFVAVNHGGEVHTFTEVAKFGGGVVDALNKILGLENDLAPECQALDDEDFIPPGATFREDDEPEGEQPGVVKYQCCIHPWMRLEARVLDK